MRLFKRKKRFVLLRPDSGGYYAGFQSGIDSLWTPTLSEAMRFTESEATSLKVYFSTDSQYVFTLPYEVNK